MPLQYLIALFIGLPILELVLLFELHGVVGFVPTVLLVFLTGIAGAALVRRQGLSTLLTIQKELNIGNLPAPQMMDGVMILIAGALLVTPGLITDVVGFSLLIPLVRERIRLWLRKKLEQKMRDGYIQVNVNGRETR
ncbi:FxsA family protein [Pontiellaceae bacterium B12227]|nr:FxsA family protein [Pontiellaceae bacterium B12227]